MTGAESKTLCTVVSGHEWRLITEVPIHGAPIDGRPLLGWLRRYYCIYCRFVVHDRDI